MRFETTRWSLVLAAGQSGSVARRALESLCETYWYPAYAYVRRRGYSSEDARDLTQSFFLSLLERDDLARVRRERGRFRSFLLAAAQHFLLNDIAKKKALKHGGDVTFRSLEFDAAEARYANEPRDDVTPEAIFDRRWALTVLERALGELRREWEVSGSAAEFQHLKPALMGERASDGYRALALQVGKSESAVKVAVHRLRRKFQQRVRAAIAETVSDEADVDEELAYLLRVLRR